MCNIRLNYVSNGYTGLVHVVNIPLHTIMTLNFSKAKRKQTEKVDHISCFKETRCISCLKETWRLFLL